MGSKRLAGPRKKTNRERWPQYDKLSLREIKRKKRKEALAVERALKQLHYGSSRLPPLDGFNVAAMLAEIKRARLAWQEWWRNA